MELVAERAASRRAFAEGFGGEEANFGVVGLEISGDGVEAEEFGGSRLDRQRTGSGVVMR